MSQEKSKAVLQIEENRAKAKLYDELKNSNSTNVALCYMATSLVELNGAFGKKDDPEKRLGASVASKEAANVKKMVQGHCDLSKSKTFYGPNTIGKFEASVPMTSDLSVLDSIRLYQSKAELYDEMKKNMTKIDSALCAMAASISEIASLHDQTLEKMITPIHAKLVRATCNMTEAVEAGETVVADIGERAVPVVDIGDADIQLAGESAFDAEHHEEG